jgi:hypothetical protein
MAIEVAVACTILETSNDVDLARMGLREVMDEFLNEWEEDELAAYVREYRRDALTAATVPISVNYKGAKSLTTEEITNII